MKEYYILATFSKSDLELDKDITLLVLEGIYHASVNLYSRFRIKIANIKIFLKRNYFVLKIKTDETDLKWGRRLRGISAYLLKTYPEKFKPMAAGSRLLTYTDITPIIKAAIEKS